MTGLRFVKIFCRRTSAFCLTGLIFFRIRAPADFRHLSFLRPAGIVFADAALPQAVKDRPGQAVQGGNTVPLFQKLPEAFADVIAVIAEAIFLVIDCDVEDLKFFQCLAIQCRGLNICLQIVSGDLGRPW